MEEDEANKGTNGGGGGEGLDTNDKGTTEAVAEVQGEKDQESQPEEVTESGGTVHDDGNSQPPEGEGEDTVETAQDEDSQPEEGEAQQEEEEDQEEQQVASFPEEDSVSRDSSKFHGLGDESSRDGLSGADPIGQKMEFEDEGQSMDATSVRSEEQSNAGNPEESGDAAEPTPEMGGEESSDSKLSSGSKEKTTNGSDQDQNQGQESSDADAVPNLMADESIMEEDDEGENVVAEVDISTMMEIDFGEDEDENRSQDAEPEVIPIDSDDEGGDKQKQNGDADAQPVVLGVDEAIYQVDEHENITEVEVPSIEVAAEKTPEIDSTSTISRRPRRAAAEAAAKTIHEISAVEQGISSSVFRSGRKSHEDDEEYNVHADTQRSYESQSPSARQKCRVCLKIAPCSIVIRQYGSDIYLCSNSCFNKFRNQGNDSQKKTLPCSKCGIMEDSNNTAYFWETMNFCSDLCVGRSQMDVGSKCCTCGSNVPWASLGKYCVRFGSDIRQFCMPQCLETYKKNARVCFNCQLDIRRAGNVILANIPSKTTPKEFCSNDCVEMYCDRNLHQPTRAKPQPEHPCCICGCRRLVYRELVLPSGSFKACSEACWRDVLKTKGVSKADKCEMCTKFVCMDLGFTTPVYWISTNERIYGFCSHVCKNLYILNSRRILACVTCKVKKYNFDLIENYTNSSTNFAVCSLACLPKSLDYIKGIRDVICIPEPTSDKRTSGGASSFPIISSVSSIQTRSRKQTMNGNADSFRDEIIELDDDDDDIPASDRILDILTLEEIEAVLQFLESRPKMRDAKCSAKPKTRTVETQTDVSELNDMERITLIPEDIVHYIPVPIPTLVHVPFPGYFLESPCPVPFPIPVPIPIPIPVIMPSDKKQTSPSQKDRKDDDREKSDGDKDSDTSKRAPTIPTVNTSNTSTSNSAQQSSGGNNTSSTSHANTSSHKPTEEESRSKSSPVDIKITADILDKGIASKSTLHHYSNSVTPTSIMPHTPEVNRRGMPGPSGHNFPSPSYSQDCCPFPTSIYPSPVSNYSPTYGSSPGPPLTPVAPIPVSGPPLVNHSIRDYGVPPAPPIAPQMSGTYSSYAMTQRHPYKPMPSAAPMIRPPVVPPVGSGYGTHSSTSMGYANAHPPSLPISTSIIPQHSSPSPKIVRVENALRAWKMMFGPSSDPRSISTMELSSKLCDLVNRGCRPNGERYRADYLLHISLGIQQLLRDNNRVDKLFYDNVYYNYVLAFTDRAERELMVGINGKIEEVHFWETSELGPSSPGVLLFTLIFMFYKHFGLKTWEMHSALQFSNIIIQSRYDHFGRYVKYMSVVGMPGLVPTEVQEDITAPDKCLIRLYEFYCFKNEIQTGPFYKCLRQDYTPRTPWFTCQPLDQRHIYQMLVRASMITCSSDSFS